MGWTKGKSRASPARISERRAAMTALFRSPQRQVSSAGTLVALTVILATSPCSALFGNAITGHADVTAVQSETASVTQETLRQDFSANWSRNLLPYLSLRSSVRYYKFDLVEEQAASAWREEFQPSGQLDWAPAWFQLSASALRRSAKARISSSNLVTENTQVSFRTRDLRYPLLTLRLDWQHIFDTDALDDREMRDRRLLAGLDHDFRTSSVGYRYTDRRNSNVISSLESNERSHLLRWSTSRPELLGGRLMLASNYSYTHSQRTDETAGDAGLLENIDIQTGLYALDSTPDFGALITIPALTDGDTDSPTDPIIDIGGALTGRNIGADLGFERPVSALYIYTDRSAGDGPVWQIYASNDNLDWRLVSASPGSTFNPALNRYELLFDSVETRYIKAVKGGVGDIDPVHVTEIEAFQSLDTGTKSTRTRETHIADMRVNLALGERAETSLGLSFRH